MKLPWARALHHLRALPRLVVQPLLGGSNFEASKKSQVSCQMFACLTQKPLIQRVLRSQSPKPRGHLLQQFLPCKKGAPFTKDFSRTEEAQGVMYWKRCNIFFCEQWQGFIPQVCFCCTSDLGCTRQLSADLSTAPEKGCPQGRVGFVAPAGSIVMGLHIP